ncbi:MAG: adenylate kinase [Dehalococcoidia bacterium]|nr:adenylate kinase [Dehalococcoidia bacterium]
MHIVLLGAPGSGKGTQAGIISQRLGIAHVASGDLFREAANRGDELGQQVKSYMEKGLLVPDEITIKMISECIAAPDCNKGFILDGFPRTLGQAKALDEALGEKGESVEMALYIEVSTKELVRRLSGRFICRGCQTIYHAITSPRQVGAGRCERCGGELYQRSDDLPETVRKRIEVYFAETSPLIDYYRGEGKLVEINGEGAIEEVEQKVLGALKGKWA